MPAACFFLLSSWQSFPLLDAERTYVTLASCKQAVDCVSREFGHRVKKSGIQAVVPILRPVPADPTRFIDAVLNEHEQFHSILSAAFHDDPQISAEMDKVGTIAIPAREWRLIFDGCCSDFRLWGRRSTTARSGRLLRRLNSWCAVWMPCSGTRRSGEAQVPQVATSRCSWLVF